MGKTFNKTYTDKPVAFIPTDVVYDIPRDGVAHTIRIPLENHTDQVNVEVPYDNVTVNNLVLKKRGVEVDITISGAVALGPLDLIIISPGGYTNENLSGDLANNALARINVIETGGTLTTNGDDNVDIYDRINTNASQIAVNSASITNNTANITTNANAIASLQANPYPVVADELARAAAYPTPEDGQMVFNQRTNTIERYYSTYGLWLSDQVFVAVSDNLTIAPKRIVYVTGSIAFNGLNAIVNYPTTISQAESTIGVTTEVGNAADASHVYVAVATRGQYYIEVAETLLAGSQIVPRIRGAGADLGLASDDSTATGVMAFALQNSGADINYPNDILCNIGLIAEYF